MGISNLAAQPVVGHAGHFFPVASLKFAHPLSKGHCARRGGELGKPRACASVIVFVPEAALDRVLDLAERIVARESAMAEAVRAGQPVTEVMHDSRFPAAEETTP